MMRWQKDNNKMLPMDNVTIEKLKSKIEAINPGDTFIDYFLPFLNDEIQKGNRSRNNYFCVEKTIIVLSFATGIFSAIRESSNALLQSGMINSITVISSFGLTALLALKGLCKYRETWLRHRSFTNKAITESIRFINGIGAYNGVKEDQALIMYKEKILWLCENTNNTFEENMKER